MRRGGAILMAALGVLAGGCHAPPAVVTPHPPAPTTSPVSRDLPVVVPTRIEPDLTSLPKADPKRAPDAVANSYRGLSEAQCQALAANQAVLAGLLDSENERPTVTPAPRATSHTGIRPLFADSESACSSTATTDALLREVRRFAALDDRNRAATEALDRYFQLADVAARTDLLNDGLKTFDDIRALAPRLRLSGLPTPDDAELLRQRAKLLADLEQAEAGLQLLTFDLTTKLGLPGADRLWPSGPFAVTATPVDAEAAVTIALESRPDLRGLRTLEHGLTPDALPAIRDDLRGRSGMLGGSPLMNHILRKRLDPAKAVDAAEVEVRRKQLLALIAAREALAAGEVRTAAAQMASAVRRIGLLQSRVESLQAKAATAKPADAGPAVLESLKAQAELLTEVMAWHQWRAKLKGAMGLLSGDAGP